MDWEQLEICWICENDEPRDDLPTNFFAQRILHVGDKEPAISFPKLTKLSLGDVSFQAAGREMAEVFKFGQLQSLTLHRCPRPDAFLGGVIDSHHVIVLSFLEITICHGDYELGCDVEWLAIFLNAFKGLREIYLRFPVPTDPIEVWRALYPHRSTLKRLVYHQTEFDTDPDSPHYEEISDDLFLSQTQLNSLKALDGQRHPFAGLNLENIGLSLDASELVRQSFIV
jgi:hypothetical protein